MLSLVAGFVLARNGAALMLSHQKSHEAAVTYFIDLLTATHIDCMAIGGIGAYAYFYYRSAIGRAISSTVIDVIVGGATAALTMIDIFIPYAMYGMYSILFCYTILSSSCKVGQRAILRMEGRAWSWLGKLSYGIYMWHMIILAVQLVLIKSHLVSGIAAHILPIA